MSNRTSNQIHELRVMASGMAGNVDEADDHSEVKLLRWAAAEIERLTRDLAMQKMLEDAMTDCIQPREGQTFEERAEELIVTEVQHQQCSADETTDSREALSHDLEKVQTELDAVELRYQRLVDAVRYYIAHGDGSSKMLEVIEGLPEEPKCQHNLPSRATEAS